MRFVMVLSSISPLFLLWGIRGTSLFSNYYFSVFCVAMIVIPNLLLGSRVELAKRNDDKRELVFGKAEDHRDHLLVYLFAMLLPFYSEDIETWRTFSATLVALGFIVFMFWHLNMHYMNLMFALLGYRVHTIYPRDDGNPLSGRHSNVLITKRASVSPDERITAYRISNTVYLEGGQ